MRQVMCWLQAINLRRVLTIVCITLALFVAPAFGFGQATQAQANSRVIQVEPNEVDPISDRVIKRIQQKAGDWSDGAKRDTGNTGLKNFRKLPENIPQTLDLIR